ncbi:AGAP005378-PB-like protein [Anopheles sinensis]|uniref:AGAP005378-PB-like protein n=1 Tax=Anopheles sinensis TaxID=74873 RepID=A0A084WEU9_ANOSI|nr:AGAP005378-PB-like protein [Anopheles sinensis]
MSSSSTMGAAGRNSSAVGDGGNHTSVPLLDPAHSLSSSSTSLSAPAEKAPSEPAKPVDSNFLTARAAREGTPPRADAQIELGVPPRPGAEVGGGSESATASGASSNSEGQPKRKVIRRIVKVRRVVKRMKKKDEKFYRTPSGEQPSNSVSEHLGGSFFGPGNRRQPERESEKPENFIPSPDPPDGDGFVFLFPYFINHSPLHGARVFLCEPVKRSHQLVAAVIEPVSDIPATTVGPVLRTERVSTFRTFPLFAELWSP